jgi:hypothetical protein
MAADELSSTGLPPIAWTSHADDHPSQPDPAEREPRAKSKNKSNDGNPTGALRKKSGTRKFSSSDVEFEHPDHELDSIA